MLSIATHMAGDVAVLQLTGRLVLEDTESELRAEIERLMRDGHVKLVLDLNAVTYIDSAGLGLLVAKYVSLRSRGGDLRLVHLTPRSMHLMAITNLASVFSTYATEELAVRSFAAA
ncbi:MAG: STAS domain-containing protein [Vicinamibacterales bacterium]